MLPSHVTVREVGPREGMQIEKGPITTESKIRLIDMLSDCGFPAIEVASFVSKSWVPQMADAEEIVGKMARREGTRYTGIYMNHHGLARALATERLDLEGWMLVSASEAFARKNTNKSIEEMFAEADKQLELLSSHGLRTELIVVMASFGCNYSGDVAPEKVTYAIERALEIAANRGEAPRSVMLADSMGWVTPSGMQLLLDAIRKRWDFLDIRLHLHDTRGLAIASAWTALEAGVSDFETSVGGLGGCPFGNFAGASGNMVTEDFVHMCHEAGITTGIDMPRLLEASRYAEEIVGHPLPGKLLRGKAFSAYRSA